MNQYLVRHLQELNLWSPAVKDAIVANMGSVQNVPDIPDDVKLLYRTAYVPPRSILEMAAERACYIDQSQSLNAFLEPVTAKRLSSLHFLAWELGLKTGMYYLRSKPIANPQQLSLAPVAPEGCVSCSA